MRSIGNLNKRCDQGFQENNEILSNQSTAFAGLQTKVMEFAKASKTKPEGETHGVGVDLSWRKH